MNFKRLILVMTAAVSAASVCYGADAVDTAAAVSDTLDKPAAPAAANWVTARCNETQCGFTPEQIGMPLSLSWQYNTEKFQSITTPPVVADGVAYFSSGDSITAVDAETGSRIWRYPSTEPLKCNIKTGLTIFGEMIYFGGSDGYVYAISTRDGHLTWTFPTGASVRSTPTIFDGNLYVGSDDNNLYCLDPITGESVWPGGFKVRDDVQSAPAFAPGIVIFVSMDTNIYAANATTGKLKWAFRLPLSPVRNAPVVSGNLAFIGCGSTLYALSTKTGVPRYTIALPSDMAAPVAVVGNDIYVVCKNRKMYAYTVGMGLPKMKWAEPVNVGLTCTAAPTVAGNTIFVTTNRGGIFAYSTEDGRMVWSHMLWPSYVGNNNTKTDFTDARASVAIANNGLYVIADDGTLRFFNSKAADSTAPKIFNVVPDSSETMSGFPPISISAMLYDEGNGVDPSTVKMFIDNQEVQPKYDSTTLQISYSTPITSPVVKLKDGKRQLMITAKDWKGNELSYSWPFTVDNTLQPKVLPKAAKPKFSRSANKNTTGTAQPSATGNPVTPGGPGTAWTPPPPPPTMGGGGIPAPGPTNGDWRGGRSRRGNVDGSIVFGR